jgi:putative transposase
MQAHAKEFRLRTMAKVLSVHISGYYAWLKQPMSVRAKEDQRLSGVIKHVWLSSGTVYGYRKVFQDLRENGERCGKHRVARLMRRSTLRAQVGYSKARPRAYAGSVSVIAPNTLNRQFYAVAPNTHWVTDITYIRTHENWLYLAVVLDLFSRQIVGWSMQSQMTSEIVMNALLMAVWRRQPKAGVMIHSDQGSQFTGSDWQSFLKAHGMICSMSRRGNCHDNAVAESFFQLLKRERVKRKIYATREHARADIFDYIEMFYNPIRRHGSNQGLSPVEFERRHTLTDS